MSDLEERNRELELKCAGLARCLDHSREELRRLKLHTSPFLYMARFRDIFPPLLFADFDAMKAKIKDYMADLVAAGLTLQEADNTDSLQPGMVQWTTNDGSFLRPSVMVDRMTLF